MPVAVGSGGPGATVPAGLRGLRGRVGFALRVRVGGGLPPRRRGCTVPVSCAPVCASALAVAAAASSTARRTARSLHLAAAAAASAAACMAAASALSAGLCRRTVGLIMTAGSVPTVAEELAALSFFFKVGFLIELQE